MELIHCSFRYEPFTPIESDAIDFTLTLLMPEDDVKLYIESYSKPITIKSFSSRFQVMPEHARLRLKKLGYKIIINES